MTKPETNKVHRGCGGDVVYQRTASAGYFVCLKCGANGLFTTFITDEKPSSGGSEPSGK